MKTYNVIIIGGGPAGLSAGIYLARFRISTLIIDVGRGRSNIPGTYHNIMGFLEPIEREKLRELGEKQAILYGAERICDKAINVEKLDNAKFKVSTESNSYFAENIIFCMGIMDNWPEAKGYENFLGYTLHSCPICAGYETIDKKIVIIGNKRVDGFALEMLNFTNKITIVTNGNPVNIRPEYVDKFKKLNILNVLKSFKVTGLISWRIQRNSSNLEGFHIVLQLP